MNDYEEMELQDTVENHECRIDKLEKQIEEISECLKELVLLVKEIAKRSK